jgi:hypothetical protein
MAAMAQPHLGERTQIRFHAPKAVVDTLTAYAERCGLPVSRVVSDLLAEAAGRPDLALVGDQIFDLLEVPTSSRGRALKETSTLAIRVPTKLVPRLDVLAREAGVRRPEVVALLLAQRVGLDHLLPERRQLQMTG